MSWDNTISKIKARLDYRPPDQFNPVYFEPEPIEWSRLVTLDFETYYDQDYTLSKLSTSEYIRDKRFKAQMVGIKIGDKPTKVYSAAKVRAALLAIPWQTHSLLAHHAQFDGFILSHHYKIQPKKIYCTMSMARGLHSNEIGAGLDELSKFYGGRGKIEGGLEPTKGVRNWSPALVKSVSVYCAQDVDECFDKFGLMLPKMPRDEIDLIDLTCRMFTDPVLKVNIPKVEAELARELQERKELMLSVLKLIDQTDPDLAKGWKKEEKALTGEARDLLLVKKHVGSNEKFATLLRNAGITKIPQKVSPAYLKDKTKAEYTYAFAKDDEQFVLLPENPNLWADDQEDVNNMSAMQLAVRSSIIRSLIDARISVKSTTNVARAQRFLSAGANGMPLPAYYAYARAHTLRWGGGDKRNMQNLKRGGALREAIEAPKGHHLCVVDSGQIEARTNAWLWEQDDLLEAFADADRGLGRDAYCLMGDTIYGRTITKADATERFVGKVAVLGLGFQMGALKLQMTLAKGALGGPPVYFTHDECKQIVYKYRYKNAKIAAGWSLCQKMIEDMALGRRNVWKCLSWDKGFILLPNGMTLKYPGLRATQNQFGKDEWTYQSGDQRKKIYGGLLTENIVQALARLIVAEQMLAISRKQRVVMTTHDECVSCVKTAQAPKGFEFMMKCFRTAPAWCSDLPLNAEGGHAFNYSK